MKTKFSVSSPTIAALIVVAVTAFPVFAGPTSTPTGGSVDPNFSTLTVGTAPARFKVDVNGILTNPVNTKPLTVSDAQGLLVTAGSGDFAVTNGGNVSNDGNLDVGDDADVNGDATAFNLNAWSTVKGSTIEGTYRVKGSTIGDYVNGVQYWQTIGAGAAKNYPGTTLKCPFGQIAMTCNYAAYSDTANCATGSASVQTNNVIATRIMLEPQGGGWGSPKNGGWCNATLKNTGGSTICGLVAVECWNPNG